MTNDTAMKITAIAPWFGGKRTMAPLIVSELGKHRAYWEPFCGGISVLLNKPPASMETVNDLHLDLTNLARVVKHRTLGPSLYRRLRRTLITEGALRDACLELEGTPQPLADTPNVERAEAYFIQSWLMRSGIAGTNLQRRGEGRCIAVRYTANGGSLCARWQNAVRSIPSWRRRLENVTILSRDGFAVIAKIDDATGTVIYLDPPYISDTRSGLKGTGATSRYAHEFHDGFLDRLNDHERLAELLSRFKRARVVVSYYQHSSLRALYPGWTCRPVKMTKAIVSQGRRDAENKVDAPEVLLINGKSYAEGA